MAAKWTVSDIPDQNGRVVVVTGANSGLGLATARELARAGAQVIVACRDTAKGSDAVKAIGSAAPAARVSVAELDLADLSSVRAFTDRFADEHEGLDLLVNNAGVMAPAYRKTADGFESQIGTNHLGHFALTGLLIDALLSRPEPRVVTVSSTAHRMGQINFDDLNSERGYRRWRAYGQSKLANLLFSFELDRRARAAGTPLRSVAAHPGYSATNLQFAGPASRLERMTMAVTNRLIAQSADMGALPTLYAATVPDLPGGAFIGPEGWQESRGHPKVVKARPSAYDTEAARRLWESSEQLTGVHYAFRAHAAA
jgi:NAD(P)-dependent dehydrogenase (short-subunit alcohol dehydrogenase family)